jgi:pilus assembly protein FimV
MPVSEEPDDAPHEPRSAPPAAEKTSAGDWVEGTGEPWDDIGLKLDLARAYLEMDDPDAARTILDEVVGEGRDDQRREAESLLAGLER